MSERAQGEDVSIKWYEKLQQDAYLELVAVFCAIFNWWKDCKAEYQMHGVYAMCVLATMTMMMVNTSDGIYLIDQLMCAFD